MTTQPSWGKPVTGLAPAGVLPLQAAHSVAKLIVTRCYLQSLVFFMFCYFNM